jgi:geranylgeranyl reductase
MADSYDVVIVGGGPGGLSCAKNLAGSGLSVLVLEKNQALGRKICSGEISSKVMPGINPASVFKGAQEWKTVGVGTAKGVHNITYQRPYLWTVGRSEFETWLRSGCDGNTAVRLAEHVTKITREYVETSGAGQVRRYKYRYLVGADGSFSTVRQFLGLPMEHIVGHAFHFVLDRPSDEFRVYWLPNIFTHGYGYMMSKNKGQTMIGGAMAHVSQHAVLAPRVKDWVRKEFGIDVKTHRSEGYRGNADYRGWKFCNGAAGNAGKPDELAPNVFLVGDAAGLLNPVTTEGIYYAVKSGEGVAKHIRNDPEGARIMSLLASTHSAQVLLFDFFTDPRLPFSWFVGWLLEDPRRGVRRILFDYVFRRFMDR